MRFSMRLRKFVVLCPAGLLFCFGLVACGSGPSGPGPIASISVSAVANSIAVSGTTEFTATAMDSRGNLVGAVFAWNSKTPGVAIINATTGQASALFPGTTEITASANGVTSLPFTLTVTPGFLLTASLPTSEFDATATLLGSGMMLIVGGDNSTTGALSAAELYDPMTASFTATGSLATPRYWAEACLLNNGKVLVAGGYNSNGFVGSAELYDPVAGTFSPTGNMVVPRRLFTMTLLPNGTVLIAGGYGASGALMESEVYDPNAGMFSVTGQMNAARRITTATLLNNGMVLVAGGINGGGTLASAELYNPMTGNFTFTGNMNTPRYYHTATLLPDGKVLIAGGQDPSGALANPLASAEIYDPSTGLFTLTSAMNNARYDHTATLLGNGTVVLAGGYEPPSVLASAEIFDPSTGLFSLTGSLNVPRGDQTAVLLKNETVLVVGGGDGNNNSLSSAEVYEPAQ